MNNLVYLYKAIRKIKFLILDHFFTSIARLQFYLNGAKLNGKIRVNGLIKVIITLRGRVTIGDNFRVNSGNNYNIIGRQQKSIFWVEGILNIGDNVGISCSAIICNHNIDIGNNVIIGGNTVIYDTDFHSLSPEKRTNSKDDKVNTKWGQVVICDNVFIGAHTTILKGVTIGKNSVVGACSVVSKNIPENEIWAGNPAQFIKKVDFSNK